MQVCRKCGIEKDLNDFWKSKRYKNWHNTICKICQRLENQQSMIKNYWNKYSYHSEYVKKMISLWKPNIIYSKKKSNAKKVWNIFDITLKDFTDWYTNTEKKCYYCWIKEDQIHNNKELMPTSNKCKLTLDRKVNDLWYVKWNIVFACSRCNLIKSNFFTSEEMKEIWNLFVKQKWKCE